MLDTTGLEPTKKKFKAPKIFKQTNKIKLWELRGIYSLKSSHLPDWNAYFNFSDSRDCSSDEEEEGDEYQIIDSWQ